MQNHYHNPNHPLRPYTHSLQATDGTLPPANATRGKEPVVVKSKWPCRTGKTWTQKEDHRERKNTPELVAQFGEGYPQEATEFWLPEDTHDSPARTMKDIGPLPKGALLERPAKAFDIAYREKLQEIVGGANTVKSALSRKYSDIEEQTWPQQEAGARAILGLEADCKDETARAILKDEEGRKAAISLVGRLAEAGQCTPESFAKRIIDNADQAYDAGIQTLLEQQTYETALKAVQMSGDVAKVEAIVVEYSVVKGVGTFLGT